MLTIGLLDVAIAQRQRAGEANHETGPEALLETMWSLHQHRERLCVGTRLQAAAGVSRAYAGPLVPSRSFATRRRRRQLATSTTLAERFVAHSLDVAVQ